MRERVYGTLRKAGLRTLATAAICLGLGIWMTATLAACAPGTYAAEPDAMAAPLTETITVAATPKPHARVLKNVVKPLLAQQGIGLEVLTFDSYDEANAAVASGEADVGYFETEATLERYNKAHDTNLAAAALIHYEPFGLYSTKYRVLASVPDGARIIIPSDAVSQARALRLLEEEGLIVLSDKAATLPTIADVAENPRNFDLALVDGNGVASLYRNADVLALNGNYAIEAGFSVEDDALALENMYGTVALQYANVLTVRDGDAPDDEMLEALEDALYSQEAKDYFSTNFRGVVLLRPQAGQTYSNIKEMES